MEVLENDPHQKMNKMSFGQLKKTYIAFALACNTKYLFMDEPLTHNRCKRCGAILTC